MGHHCTAAVPPTHEHRNAPVVNGNTSDPAVNGNVGPAVNGNGIVSPIVKGNGSASAVNGTNGIHATNGQSSIPEHKLLVFSAFDEKATRRSLEQYSTWYQVNEISSSAAKFDALAHTLAARRSHMRWRSFAVAIPSSPARLFPAKPVRVVSDPSMAWVFTGQGAQYVDMGLELASVYPVFEDTLKRVEEVYGELGCNWSIFGKSEWFPTRKHELV